MIEKSGTLQEVHTLSHYTDTHLYSYSVTLVLLLITINNSTSVLQVDDFCLRTKTVMPKKNLLLHGTLKDWIKFTIQKSQSNEKEKNRIKFFITQFCSSLNTSCRTNRYSKSRLIGFSNITYGIWSSVQNNIGYLRSQNFVQ